MTSKSTSRSLNLILDSNFCSRTHR